MTDRNTQTAAKRQHLFICCIGMSISLSISSMGADSAFGIPGVHYFLHGMAIGILIVSAIWRWPPS